ncbi:MAG: two-component hybrid sensor and regulator [Bacteroidetes bacterium]|nr:two-component hybrid sensor and regulator [Bacteroidota bacterium]
MTQTDFLIVENPLQDSGTAVSSILAGRGWTNIRSVSSMKEAITAINERRPDIVLTDTNLEGENAGIELGHLLSVKYNIPFIFTSSQSNPEVLRKAIVTRPYGYIIRPFRNEELMIAIELALFSFNALPGNDQDELVIKKGRSIVRLQSRKILWVEAEGNYCVIRLQGGERKEIRITFAELQTLLNGSDFIRIHKSYIVNKRFVTEVRTGFVMLNNLRFPVGRTYQKEVRKFFK